MPNGTTNPFLEAAREAFRRTKADFVEDVFSTPPRSAPSPDSVVVPAGNQTLADLMYAFVRGGKDRLIEKATEKFRESETGQQVEQEAKTQALQDVISNPAFIVTGLAVAVGIVLVIGLVVGRVGR